MAQLQFRDAQGKEVALSLTDEAVIGRQEGCDIRFPREFISRRHARLFRRGTDWLIEDLGSSHGTFVNRLRIQGETLLADGDRIRVGDEVLRFVGGETRDTLKSAESSPAGGGGPRPEGTATRSEPDITGEEKIGEIVARRSVEGGGLMRTMIGIRKVDVELLNTSAERMPTPAELPGAVSRPGDASPESQVDSHLLALVRIADGLRRCTTPQAVADTAVRMAMRATKASRGVLALRDPGRMRDFVPVAEVTEDGAPVHVSRTFVDEVVSGREALLAADTGADARVKNALSIAVMDIKSILCAPLWDGDEIHGYLYLDSTRGRRLFRPSDLDLVSAIAYHAASEIARLNLVVRVREEETRRKNLSRFLSADVIRHLEDAARAGKADPTESATESEVTILFADIQGFTSIAERMSPAEVKKLLDEYLDRMTEILVDRHGGTLDKYIGDAIMAVFGSPYSRGREADAKAAVAAAVEMRATMDSLRRTRKSFAGMEMRIGINTGKVIAGTIGSKRRLDFTVIGDTVNVASRLESTGEAGRIQIGERTFQSVEDAFECTFAGERPVKNRKAPVKSWWVAGPKG